MSSTQLVCWPDRATLQAIHCVVIDTYTTHSYKPKKAEGKRAPVSSLTFPLLYNKPFTPHNEGNFSWNTDWKIPSYLPNTGTVFENQTKCRILSFSIIAFSTNFCPKKK